jgi:hypothetical protein
MAVVADFGLPADAPEIDPVPQRRQGLVGLRRLAAIQRGGERGGAGRLDDVILRLGFPDPLLQHWQIDFHIDIRIAVDTRKRRSSGRRFRRRERSRFK